MKNKIILIKRKVHPAVDLVLETHDRMILRRTDSLSSAEVVWEIANYHRDCSSSWHTGIQISKFAHTTVVTFAYRC